jgi:hypothetical protein
MKTEILFIAILLVMPVVVGAQENSSQDSGILSSLPDIQINSVDDYNNSTGQASSGQSTLSWIIVLVLVFLGVVIYSFDIDPKWVVILIGVTAVVFSVARLGLMPF